MLIVRRRRSRAERCRGAEVLEFTFVFLPMMAMIILLIDVAWAVFVKATLEYAVRAGVRSGITITGSQASLAGSDLTTMVKTLVQTKSIGILRGTTGYAKIKVHYFQPPAEGSTAAAVDVSNQTWGNTPLYIMQVSVEGYVLPALVPRLFGLNQPMDASGTPIAAVSADLIEPSRDVPPIGSAP
jgi:Flp pilus assembly protein TadG